MIIPELEIAAIKVAIVHASCEAIISRKRLTKELFFNDYESITFSLQEVMEYINKRNEESDNRMSLREMDYDNIFSDYKKDVDDKWLKNRPRTIQEVVSCMIGLSYTSCISSVYFENDEIAMKLLNGDIDEEILKKELFFISMASTQVLRYNKYILKAFQEQSLEPLQDLRTLAELYHSNGAGISI